MGASDRDLVLLMIVIRMIAYLGWALLPPHPSLNRELLTTHF